MVLITSISSEREVRGYLDSVKRNCPFVTDLKCSDSGVIQNFTNEQWEQFGRDMSKNEIHLSNVSIYSCALSDDKMSFFFSGLTGNRSIQDLNLSFNGFGASGARSMVSFLQHSNCLRKLNVSLNKIQSEGVNVLLRALRDSPIENLFCVGCGFETIEIDEDNFPKKLQKLDLSHNNINVDGYREIAQLLRRGNNSLSCLELDYTGIGDEGVAILVGALQNNTTLKELSLSYNNDISIKGRIELLKLLNDLTSYETTLQSNHILQVSSHKMNETSQERNIIKHIQMASKINGKNQGNPEAARREKVIRTHLNSVTRASLAEFQGVSDCFYSEINPLHLPEVLSLVSRYHGKGELYAALKSSIAAVISMVDMKQCVKQRLAHYVAKSEQLRMDYERQMAYYKGKLDDMNTRLAVIEAAEGSSKMEVESEDHGSRPRKRSRA